jgi:transketolase
MRTAFIEELVRLAAQDERIWLVCGDLGYSVLEAFANRYPKRFLNAGVAEQNMTGVAAGLAMMGKIVFTYSIANFPVMRCLEQIRNDICYHNLSVKIVAVGGGLAYASHGYTHHGVEDLAVMSALPNIAVAAPADPVEARLVLQIIASRPGPAYLRLGKAGEPVLHQPKVAIAYGKSIVARDGHSLTLISTGGMLANTLAACDKLEDSGYSVRVVSMPFIVPLDEDTILSAITETGVILTIEEHGFGGLGTAVGECIARSGGATVFLPLRLERSPIRTAGSQEQLRASQGLHVRGIVDSAMDACRRRSARPAGMKRDDNVGGRVDLQIPPLR